MEFSAKIGDLSLKGIDLIQFNDEGKIKDFEVFVRPANALQALAARSEDPVAFIKAFQEGRQELALASDILRNRALDAILSHANPVDEDGNPVDLSLKVSEVEAEVVADDVEGDVVVAEVVEEEE